MPKYDKSTFIVYLDLPDNISAEIDKIRKEVDSPGLKRWVAHITLKQEADYLPESVVKMQKILKDFSQKTSPMILNLEEIALKKESDGESWNIYAKILERDFLHELTKKLSLQLVPLTQEKNQIPWEQTDDYYAHISIINGKDYGEGEKLQQILCQKYELFDRIICASITLAQWNQTHWQKIQTWELGK